MSTRSSHILAISGLIVLLIGNFFPLSALGDEVQQPPARKEPIAFHFTLDRYAFDPSAVDSLVSLSVTNNTDAPLMITHFGEHSAMLAELPRPITVAPGSSTEVKYSVKSRMLPPSGMLSAAIGIRHNGQIDVVSQRAPYGLIGSPLVSPEGVSWKSGEKAVAKTIKVTLGKGQKLVGIKAIGDPNRFHSRVDANDSSVTIWPDSTEHRCYNGFSLMTDPQIDPRLQIIVSASIN